jgi:hypothetical protein
MIKIKKGLNMIYSTYTKRNYSLAKIIGFLFLLVVNACEETEDVNTLLTVVRIIPAAALPGETISIYGKGFSSTPSDNLVFFDGVKATVQQVKDTVLEVQVPERVTSGAIEVRVGDQRAFSPLFQLATTVKIPELKELSVSSIEVGQTLLIKGSNFSTKPEENIVRIGGVRATMISGTESQLTVAVPGLPTGEDKQVTVAVSGNISNPMNLTITGFPGKLLWGPVYKYSTDFDATSFIISANADGSSNALQRKAIPLSADLALKDNIPYAIDFTINAQTRQMIYTNFKYDKFGNALYDVGKVSSMLWNDFRSLHSSDAPNKTGFSYPIALISSKTDNRFFMVGGNQSGDKIQVFAGSSGNEEPLSVLGNTPDISVSTLFESTADFIYANSYQQPVLYRFSTFGEGHAETFATPANEIVVGMAYSTSDNSLYTFINETGISADLHRKIGVYKFVENTAVHQKVAEFDAYSDIANITVLTADSGLKIFWRAAFSRDNQVATLWMLNISGATPHLPVVLYQNPLFMSGSYKGLAAETMALMQAVEN